MYSTFTRGLELLETIDVYGPLTVSELARQTGIDKSAISRMLRACEPEGWIARDGNRISLGPRAALLAHFSPGADLIRQAEPLVEAAGGVTGLLVQAYALVGARTVVVASAGGAGTHRLPVGLGTSAPLFATAASHAVAVQLSEAELSALLPPEPYPNPLVDLLRRPGFRAWADDMFGSRRSQAPQAPQLVTTRRQLEERMAGIRADRVALDRGEIHPDLCCVAVPWEGAAAPASLACMCSPGQLSEAEPLVLAVLAAAASPGARREDVVAAAAAFEAARRGQALPDSRAGR